MFTSFFVSSYHVYYYYYYCYHYYYCCCCYYYYYYYYYYITGENYRPDLLFLIQSKFESNLNKNAVLKKEKMSELDQRN